MESRKKNRWISLPQETSLKLIFLLLNNQFDLSSGVFLVFYDMFVQDNETQISVIQCLNVAGGFDFCWIQSVVWGEL